MKVISFNNKDNLYYGYTYLIINSVNNKMYVGQTRRTTQIRWKQHIQSAARGNEKFYLYNAFNKYGVENFIFKELHEYKASTEKELIEILNNEEKKFIVQYNTLSPNGYNMTQGGECDAEARKKPVTQYSLKGEFIKKHESMFSACESLQREAATPSHIGECCKGQLHTAYGYVWRYNDEPFNLYPITNQSTKKIDQYSINGDLLHTYNSIIDVDNTFQKGISSKVCNVCRGINHTAYGYVWRYHGEPFNKYPVKNKSKKSFKIKLYDTSNNFVGSFHIKEILQKFEICRSTAYRYCKDNKLHRNYYWCLGEIKEAS